MIHKFVNEGDSFCELQKNCPVIHIHNTLFFVVWGLSFPVVVGIRRQVVMVAIYTYTTYST